MLQGVVLRHCRRDSLKVSDRCAIVKRYREGPNTILLDGLWIIRSSGSQYGWRRYSLKVEEPSDAGFSRNSLDYSGA